MVGYINGATPNPVFAENGMVVSTSLQASIAGIEILKKGGNAVDAACATGFVLAVTSSSNGNIGGGGFMVVHMADNNIFTLDYREIAPAAAHQDMFLDSNGDVIDDMSLRTRASVKHYPLARYVHPDEFKKFKELALSKGFLIVASSPLTRSSYHADEDFAKMKKLREKQSQCHLLQ